MADDRLLKEILDEIKGMRNDLKEIFDEEEDEEEESPDDEDEEPDDSIFNE